MSVTMILQQGSLTDGIVRTTTHPALRPGERVHLHAATLGGKTHVELFAGGECFLVSPPRVRVSRDGARVVEFDLS